MGLILEGGSRLKCDGMNGDAKCQSFYSNLRSKGLLALLQEALDRGWKLISGKWFCPQCVKKAH